MSDKILTSSTAQWYMNALYDGSKDGSHYTVLYNHDQALRADLARVTKERDVAFAEGYKDACDMHASFGFDEGCRAELDLALAEWKKADQAQGKKGFDCDPNDEKRG